MYMIRQSLFYVYLYVLSFVAFGQIKDTPFSSKYVKRGLRPALLAIKEADVLVYRYGDYADALKLYRKAFKANNANGDLNYKMAEAYYGLNQLDPALYHARLAYELKGSAQTLKLLARVYHRKMYWKVAIEYYQVYYYMIKDKRKKEAKSIQDNIRSCELGSLYMKESRHMRIIPLPFKSKGDDFHTVPNKEGTVIYFTSNSRFSKGFEPSLEGTYFEDIFYLSKTKNGTWSSRRVQSFNKNINSLGHESILALSNSGRVLVLYKGSNNGDIYTSRYSGKGKKRGWQKPIKMPKPINSSYRENSAALDPTGKKLFFTSNRPHPKRKGGLDIYMSRKTKKGWSKPINLQKLNTASDEQGLFMSYNGDTLYFSTDGRNGIGGYDIYCSYFEKGAWSEPVHLPLPINTAFDDMYIAMTADRKYIYKDGYESKQSGARSLYVFEKSEVELPTPKIELSTPNKPYLRKRKMETESIGGIIYDSVSRKSIPNAEIYLYDTIENLIVGKQISDVDGQFKFEVLLTENLVFIAEHTLYKPSIYIAKEHVEIYSSKAKEDPLVAQNTTILQKNEFPKVDLSKPNEELANPKVDLPKSNEELANNPKADLSKPNEGLANNQDLPKSNEGLANNQDLSKPNEGLANNQDLPESNEELANNQDLSKSNEETG